MSTPFTSLNYYKVDPDLAGHPKIQELADELGIDEWTALGHWHGVLSWASKYVPESGNLSRYPFKRVARAAGWQGDPDLFIKALVKAEFCMEIAKIGTQRDTHIGTHEETHVGTYDAPIVVIKGWFDWHSDVIEGRDTSEAKSKGGQLGSHRRWHKEYGGYSETCDYCIGILSEPIKDTHMRIVEESKVEKSKTSEMKLPSKNPKDDI